MPICCVCKHAWHIQCLHSGQRPAANNDKDWKCPTCVTQARKASFVQCTWVPKGTTVQCGRDIQPKFGVTCVGCNLRFCGAHSKGRDTSAWRCNACDVKPKPLEVDCAYPHCSKEGGKVALKTAWRCNSCKGYFHVSHTDGKQRKDSVLGYNLSQTGPPPTVQTSIQLSTCGASWCRLSIALPRQLWTIWLRQSILHGWRCHKKRTAAPPSFNVSAAKTT
eukprot:PhM_4_TR3081/c1_g1_i3/m.53897